MTKLSPTLSWFQSRVSKMASGRTRRAIALWTSIAVLNLCIPQVSGASRISSDVATGAITIDGLVTVNGSPAVSGQTIVTGSTIVTGPESELILSLDSMARVRLEAATRFDVEFSRSRLFGSLEDGSLRGFVPAGLPAEIRTADASIAIDAREPVIFSIKVESCNTTVTVQAGQLQVSAGNHLKTVASGEQFSSSSDAAITPDPQQNFNKKKAGVFVAIGATITVLLVALTHDRQTETQSVPDGTVQVPSPR